MCACMPVTAVTVRKERMGWGRGRRSGGGGDKKSGSNMHCLFYSFPHPSLFLRVAAKVAPCAVAS